MRLFAFDFRNPDDPVAAANKRLRDNGYLIALLPEGNSFPVFQPGSGFDLLIQGEGANIVNVGTCLHMRI